MKPLVQSYLPEKISRAFKISVVFFKIAFKRLCFKSGIFSHKFHVLMLRVVLKISVERVAPRRLHDI